MKKFVFLDRDGVINKYPGDGSYILNEKEFYILEGVAEAVKKLKESGFYVFVVSNQACVSKGLIKAEDLIGMTYKFLAELDRQGAFIDGVYYCIHRDNENCPFRKPSPELVFEIYRRQQINWQEEKILSYFVGDSIIDIKTAKASGCRSILVFSGREKRERERNWEVKPDYVADNLFLAVDLIIQSKQ